MSCGFCARAPTGATCPSATASTGSLHKRFSRWAKAVWRKVFASLIKDRDNKYLMLDTTLVRAHQQAATGKGGPKPGLGRSRGGLTTKIHMLADTLGRPLRFILTPPAQAGDVTTSCGLLEGFKAEAVLADKAYDANGLRGPSSARWAPRPSFPAIRPESSRIPHDKMAYRLRNRIERCFNKLANSDASQPDTTAWPATSSHSSNSQPQ
ncbi:MAG: IS5 family transposase [Rhizobiaceae bacterium]